MLEGKRKRGEKREEMEVDCGRVHRDSKVTLRNLCLFFSARTLGFYFDCVQLTIDGRGHVTQVTVQNQNKNNLPESRDKYRVV